MRKGFGMMLTPLMKELVNRLPREKPEEVLKNDNLLKELSRLESNADPLAMSPGNEQSSASRSNVDDDSDLEDLKKELQQEPETAVENNLEVFTLKFDKQKAEIIDEITKALTRESDRVIKTLSAGPHDRILDHVSHLSVLCVVSLLKVFTLVI